ncbi:hypothetical protein BRD00_02600 [Halobacteriales archaeon QS_8_69_26]|nr:MAG: hypothetical protein BRD00_02600 [Halobacteriales archaeon QS_8_69_26]
MPETTPDPPTADPAELPTVEDPTGPSSAELPTTVDTPRLERVYRHLARTGGDSVDGIAEALDLRSHALVTVLTVLDRRGAVERVDGEYVVRTLGEAG